VRNGSTVDINPRTIFDSDHASRMCYVLIWTKNQIDGCDIIRDDRMVDDIESML
jgi:hypothetical protein